MTSNIPFTFEKIEILVKEVRKQEVEYTSIENITYLNCDLTITGEYLLVSIPENLTTTVKVFNLKDIDSYRTHKNQITNNPNS